MARRYKLAAASMGRNFSSSAYPRYFTRSASQRMYKSWGRDCSNVWPLGAWRACSSDGTKVMLRKNPTCAESSGGDKTSCEAAIRSSTLLECHTMSLGKGSSVAKIHRVWSPLVPRHIAGPGCSPTTRFSSRGGSAPAAPPPLPGLLTATAEDRSIDPPNPSHGLSTASRAARNQLGRGRDSAQYPEIHSPGDHICKPPSDEILCAYEIRTSTVDALL